jgi:hypothetical protein
VVKCGSTGKSEVWKWIKDLNIRLETLKQLQKVVGNTLEYIGIGNNFLSRTQKGSASKRKNAQMGPLHTKELLHSKRNSH